MLFPRRPALICSFAAALLALCSAGARAQRYVNVDNNRFATVSSGPQSSLIVDVPRGAAGDVVVGAINRRVRADWAARSRALASQLEQARRSGLLKGKGVLPFSTLVTLREGGRLVVPPRATRAVGGGALTFTYTGWSGEDEAFLRHVQELAYPRIRGLYGDPAWTGNVTVVNMGPLDGGQATNVQRLAFGAYDVAGQRILLPRYDDPDSRAHAFLLLMIHAFHGPAYFAYDAWEQGFARAAASILSRDPAFGFQDVTANHLYSLLRFYDLLNQPPLGNPTFFPPSQANVDLVSSFSLGKMFFPRLGMSGAAWLKVYIENQNFFKQFNAAYYAQFDPAAQPSLAGNVPALRALAAAALRQGRPDDTVEGLPFDQWYERQYVLDTSVALGNKLYAFVNPSESDAVNGQSALISLVYFRTKGNGDEDLLSGRAYATYFDASDARVNLGGASEQAPISAGEGFLTTLAFPTPGFDAGRITMDFHVGNETARSYLPSGFKGDFQVVVLGATTGSVTVRQITPQARTATGKLENGGSGVTLGMGARDLGVSVVEVTVDNVTTPYRFNMGDGQYYAVIRARGGVQPVPPRTFPAGLSLVSFPVRPLQTNAADALGLPPTDFLLSYWDPTKPGYQTFSSGLSGGPTIAPIQTGRGYWLKVFPPNGSVVNMKGVAPPEDTDVTVSLPYGWNLIGTPFGQGTEVKKLLVQYLQNDAISWSDAVSHNLVQPQPFEYNPQTNNYAPQAADTGRLEQWKGYWVRVLAPSGVTLILPGPSSRARAVPSGRGASSEPSRPDWTVHLHARTETAGAATATLGAARAAKSGFDNQWDLQAPEAPPDSSPVVSLHFPHPDWAAGRYVADFRDLTSGRASWDVAVTSPRDDPVTVFWDGIGTVPRHTRLTLVDKATGTRTLLRGRSSYTFPAVAGQSRALQVVAEPERSFLLTISDVSVLRTRGVGNLAISYTVSDEAAETTVEVHTLGGRTLQRLQGGRAENTGRRTVVWDGREADGAPVPAGPYAVTITARGADGALMRQIRPILVLR